MTRATTSRGGLPYYAGGDIPAGMDQQKDLAQVLGVGATFFDQGAYADLGGSSLPANADHKGYLYYATDGKAWFYCDGSTWVLVAAQTPVLTSVPTALFEGQRFAFRPDISNQPWVRWEFERQNSQWVLTEGAAWRTSLTADTGTQPGQNGDVRITAASVIVPFAGTYDVDGWVQSVAYGGAVTDIRFHAAARDDGSTGTVSRYAPENVVLTRPSGSNAASGGALGGRVATPSANARVGLAVTTNGTSNPGWQAYGLVANVRPLTVTG